jgi:hypothetical protein
MANTNYIPAPGQLCQAYKSFDSIFPVEDSIECLVADTLIKGDIVMITKVDYQEEFSNYYVELMKTGKLYYCNFYEQVLYFEMDGEGIRRSDQPISTFDFPWVCYD